MSQTSLEWIRVVKRSPKNVVIQQPSNTKSHNSLYKLNQVTPEKNVREQKKIDNDVQIAEFLSEPKDDYWMELIKITAVAAQKVHHHKILKSQNEKYYMIIRFSDKMSQELFVKEVNKANLKTKEATTKIHVHKRLTKFNSSVEKELKELAKKLAIYSFRRNEFLFEAKLRSSSPWTLIDTQEALTRFTTAAIEYQDDEVERRINYENQKELDLQIAIQRFPFKPSKPYEIIANFMNHFKLPFNQAKSHYIEKTANKWTIFLNLSEKSAQRQILKARNKKIQLGKLIGNNDNVNINWKRALTSFNERVNSSLAQAVKDKKVFRFEFYDHSFRFKIVQNSKWLSIKCNSDLDKVLQAMMQDEKAVNETSLDEIVPVESMSTSLSVISVESKI